MFTKLSNQTFGLVYLNDVISRTTKQTNLVKERSGEYKKEYRTSEADKPSPDLN